MFRRKLRRLSGTIVVLGLMGCFGLFADSARAAIVWGGAMNISGTGDVATLGAGVYAYDWDGSTNTTVNGVTFTATSSGTGVGNVTLSGEGNDTLGMASASGLPTAYLNLVNGTVYGSLSGPATVTLNALTSGHQYATQFWTNDSRGAGFNETLASTGGNSVTLAQNTSGAAGGKGQYALGYFTAGSTSQAFTVSGGYCYVQALQLRDVTGTWSGATNGTWSASDSTSQNFSGLSYAASGSGVTSLVNNVFFADLTAAGGSVSTTAVNVGIGGISIGNVYFQNNALSYTLTSSDSVGITGATAVTLMGSGLVTFAGSNSYTGTTTINGGTLQIGNGGSLGTGAITNNSALVFNSASNLSLAAPIGGSGTLSQIGPGTLTLNGSAVNTYTGGTKVNAGTLRLDFSNLTTATNLINPASALTLGGGSLSINGSLSTATSQTFASLAVNPGVSAISLTANGGNSNTLTITSTASTKANGGVLNFSLPAGTVVAWNPTLTNGIIGPGFTIGSGTSLQYATTSSSGIAAYTGATALPTTNPGNTPTANYTATGNYAFTAGTNFYANTILYTGSSGTIDNTGDNNIGFNGLIAAGPAGTTLTIGHNATYNYVTDGSYNSALSFHDIVITGPQNVTVLANFYGSPTVVSQLTYAGGGVLTLAYPASSGANAVTALNVSSGTVVCYGGINLPTVNAGGTLQFGDNVSGNDGYANGNPNISNNGAIVYNLYGASTYSGAMSGKGSLAKIGVGILSLSGSNTYSGGTTINGGALQFANSSALPAGTRNITINYGGALAVAGLQTTVTNWLNTNNIVASSSGALALMGSTSNEAINMSGYPSLSLGATGNTTYSGVLTPSATTYNLGGGGGVLTVSSTLADGASSYGAFISGPGNVIFAASNTFTYSGPTSIGSAGTLTIGAGSGSNAQGLLASQTIIDAGTLAFNHGDSATYAGAISGSGGLAQTGSGMLTLPSANSYSGPTTISAGTLQLGNTGAAQNSTVVVNAANGLVFSAGLGTAAVGGLSGSANVVLNDQAAPPAPINLVVGSNNASTTYSGAMSGSGSLTKAGGGILTLSTAANTYSGGTIVNGGTLAFANVLSGGSGNIVGSLTINPGATVNQSGNWFLGFTPGADVNTVNINQGTLYFPANNGLSASSVTMTGGTISGIATGSGCDWYNGNTNTPTLSTVASSVHAVISGNMNLRLTSAGNLTFNVAQGSTSDGVDLLVSGAISNASDSNAGGGIIKSGAGLMELTGSNSYSGSTSITAGTLEIAGAGSLGSGSPYAAAIANSGALVVNTTTNQTFSGALTGGGSLTQLGASTLTLANAATNYTGATMVSNGRLVLTNLTGYNSPTTIAAGGRLSWSGTTNVQNSNSADSIALTSGGTLEDVNPANWVVLDGTVTASGSTTINLTSNATTTSTEGFFFDGGLKGSGTCTINATNPGSGVNLRNNNSTFAGTLIVNGSANTTPYAGSGISVGGCTTGLTNADITLNGTMELLTQGIGWGNAGSGAFKMGALSGSGAMVGNYTGSGVTIVTLGYTNNNGSYSGVIANGTGDTVYLVKTGSGTQALSGASSYSGGTTIGTSNGGTTVGGIVLIANSQALGTGNVTITAGNPASTGLGAQLQLAGGITVTNPAMTISGYGFGADNGVICNTSGNNTITSAISLASGAGGTTIASNSGTLTLAGNLSASATGRTLEFTGAGNMTVSGAISNGSTVGLPVSMTGSGLLLFSGPNTYTGVTTVSSGTLQLGDGAQYNGAVTGNIANNATLVFANPNAQAYAGTISGVGNLRKTAAGLLTLSGNNTYSGASNVNAGTLLISGSLATPTVTVANGATLTGAGNGTTTGLIAGNVTVNGGGAIDFTKNGLPAGSTTTLLMNGLTLGDSTSAANLTFNVNTSNTLPTDLINLGSGSGTLTVNPGGAIVNIAASGLAPGSYNLISYGTLAGSGSISLNPADTYIGLSSLSLTSATNALELNVVGNPTPALAYWSGNYSATSGGSATWGGFSSGPITTNWSVDSGGVNDAGQIVGGVSDVVFSASSAQGPINTTLDANYAINSLTVTTSGAVSIAGSSQSLTINAAASATGGMGYAIGNGIVMQPGAGPLSISASSVIPAANQSWTNNSSSLLTVASNVTGTALTGNTTVLTLAGSGSGGSLLSGNMTDGSGGGKLALTVNTTGGAVELTGSNTYTGATTVSAGVLLLGNSATIQNSTVTVNAANGLAFIAGLGAASLPGLSGSSGFALNDQATPAGPISLIVGSNNASTVYSGAMSGSGSLTKSGSGTLTLSGVNTFTGGTTVSSGTLAFGTVPAGGVGNILGNLTINPGATVNATLGNGWSLGYTSGVSVNTVNINQGTMVFNASAGGGGIAASSVTMTGGTLSGSGLDWYYGNSYNPTLYTLASSAHSTISANVNLRLNAATNNLTFNVAQGTTSDGVDLLVTGNITAGGSASGNGGGIIKTGSGVMVLAGSNSYNGATTVSGGTLELENTSANANTFAAGNININNGATLRVAYTNENQYWFDGNTFTFDSNGGGVIDTTNSSLNFVNGSPGDTFVTTGGSRDAMIGSSGLNLNGYTATFNIARGTDPTADMTVSYLSNSGNILKTGSGILALVGASMAYTGSTTVNAGMLVINATAATGDNFGNSSGFTIASGGTLQLLSNCTGYHRWVPGTVQITGAGTFLRTGSASIFFANGTSAVTFNQSAGGLADFEGGLTSYMETTTTNSGGLTINSGTAGIQGSAYFDALNGNNGGVLYVNQNAGTLYLGVAGGSGAFAGQIESGQALVKQGAGLQVLSGANTYSGGTTISGGTLQYGVNNSLPTSGAVHVSGGTLDLNTFNGTVGAVTMVNGAITGNSGATLTGASYAVQNGMISANLAGASATLTKSTTGIVLLSGSNSYGGGTIINNSGILQLGNPAALGTGSLVANGGTLDLAGYSVAVSSFSGAAGTVTNNGGTVATLTVNQAGNTVFGGSINDGASSMALNLTGSGTLTLTNSNAYSGPTTIAGGVLYAGVAGALSSSSAVTISGGTLDASNSLQAILSLTMTGANPALILSATNPLTSSSSGTATFAGTLNVLNYTTGSVAELMTYGAHTGTFTTVDVNGVAMPATDELLYQPTYLEILPSGPPTWASASSGSWTTPTNWIGTLPGTAAGQKAIINAPTIQQVTITLDSPQTLGALTLGNSQSSTSGYTLATGIAGSLTMATSDGSAAVITVTDGSHVIQANVVLAGSLTIAPSTGSTLEIDGNMSESLSGSGSLLLADAGTLILGGTNSFTGGTVVETGTLILTNNAALAEGSSLTIGDAAAFSAEELRVEGRESSGTPTLNSQLSTLNSPLAASPSITPVPEPGTLLLLLAFGLWSAVTCHRFSRRRKVGS